MIVKGAIITNNFIVCTRQNWKYSVIQGFKALCPRTGSNPWHPALERDTQLFGLWCGRRETEIVIVKNSLQ